MKLLLLEDDPILSKEIKSYLQSKKLECSVVYDGELFFKVLRNETFDIYLLDINVPRLNGLEVCKQVRQTDLSTPILMLTAYGEIEDKLEAFDLGADDYLVKPFHLEELHARIIALYRRREAPVTDHRKLIIGDLKVDLDNKTAERDGKPISLTPKEFNLLSILIEAKGRVISKQQIADKLWDYHIETNQNTIEVYINFLRNKIDKNFNTKLIHTKIGFGYYLSDESSLQE